jgi:tetratricopeptide (TPR) repeat protein
LYRILSAILLVFAVATPARAEWQEARSRHFIIYADEPPVDLRRYVERLERFDQAVRIVRKMNDPALSDANRVRIFVLPNQGSIENLCGCNNVVGFYITRASGSVAFVPRKAGLTNDKYDMDADSVFFHEYSHHLQMQGADVGLPGWAREGFAEFFARTDLRDDGSVVIGIMPAYRGYSLMDNNSLSIRDMLSGKTTFDNYAEYEGIYSRGWALTHYLAFDPSRRGQFDRYIEGIQKGVPPLTAAKQAFGDLDSLTAELGSYVRRPKLPSLVLTGIKVDSESISIRSLSPAETDILPTYIRAERKLKSAERDVASDANKEASKYPADRFVQAVLAQAELNAHHFAEADAASDRALAADPNSFNALLDKGEAEMELAHAGGHGDWHSVRSWFLKANKIDPEAAEPLAMFYKTYLYAGERPTKNAIDALLYAVVLAPQDDSVRLMAVRQLLVDRDTDKAKQTFAPFAYSPHSKNVWRANSERALAAMEQGNATEAMTHIEALQALIEKDD